MTHIYRFVFIIMAWSWCVVSSANTIPKPTTMTVHHELAVSVQLSQSQLIVQDSMTLPKQWTKPYIEITLNPQLSLKYQGKLVEPIQKTAAFYRYRLAREAQQDTLLLTYQGKLNSTPDCQWLKQACRLLNEKGVYLDGSSYWYPQLENTLQTFEIKLQGLPKKWVSLSQGQQTEQGWKTVHPQQQVYLIAAPFSVHEKKIEPDTKLAVYLLHDDPALAKRYLDKSEYYLKTYSQYFGAYPYTKFVVAESFWETGWGMPSFTLLGSKVMSLPFILDTSLPHELLHNWWGNGVYVDSSLGNWSEGLTAYLSDHQQKELSNQGKLYRRDTLQRLALFSQNNKTTLSQFKSRHDRASQALGYGKSMLLFHALKQKIGAEKFQQALKKFYQTHRFQQASFLDLQQAFTQVTEQDLSTLFQQELYRTGTPKIQLGTVLQRDGAKGKEGGKSVEMVLKQTQRAKAFAVDIPIDIYEDENLPPTRHIVSMKQKEQRFTLPTKEQAVAVMVDPDFDVLRTPLRGEVPPSLERLFKREDKVFVMARKLDEAMRVMWEDLAKTLNFGKEPQLQFDDEVVPEDAKTLVLFGGDNALLSQLLTASKQPFKLTEASYRLNNANYMCGLHSLALTFRAGDRTLILLDASTLEGLERLMQKLPHYGKYSYAIFNSTNGKNVAKGQWEVYDSPLLRVLKP